MCSYHTPPIQSKYKRTICIATKVILKVTTQIFRNVKLFIGLFIASFLFQNEQMYLYALYNLFLKINNNKNANTFEIAQHKKIFCI